MSNFVQVTAEPTMTPVIEMPNIANYTDAQLITYAAQVSLLDVTNNNHRQIREQLKSEILARVQELVKSIKTNAEKLKCLMEAYVYVVSGGAIEGNFNAPSHIWSNDELEQSIMEFTQMDSNDHNFRNTSAVLDMLDLYCRRIANEH